MAEKGKSHIRIDNAWIEEYLKDFEGDGNAFMVYCVLRKFAHHYTHVCYPSQDKISEITGLSRVTVNKAVKKLMKLGYVIAYQRRWEHSGKYKNNTYCALPATVGSGELSRAKRDKPV